MAHERLSHRAQRAGRLVTEYGISKMCDDCCCFLFRCCFGFTFHVSLPPTSVHRRFISLIRCALADTITITITQVLYEYCTVPVLQPAQTVRKTMRRCSKIEDSILLVPYRVFLLLLLVSTVVKEYLSR